MGTHSAPQPTAILLVSKEELSELVAAACSAALSDQAPQPVLLDRADLAIRLSTSPSSVDRMRREGAPHVIIGSSPRFRLDDVLAWLATRGKAQAGQ
jgi:hypothetical protein